MKIKSGVTLHGLNPQMILAVIALHDHYRKHNAEVVITSGNDGRHSEKSLHYAGNALDFRVWTLGDDYEEKARKIVASLQLELGRDFLVLFETDHIHIQYQPRRPE